MKKITVLGAGLIGNTIAAFLSEEFDVTSADIDDKQLMLVSKGYTVKTVRTDFNTKRNLKKLISETDLVICAVPGFMGFNILKSIIEEKKNVVDISFFDQDPFVLDKLAKENKVTAVIDCGLAPGMSNIILGYYSKQMKIKAYKCYVGGLPFKRELPFQYKAPFSPSDVIEEYTRPARLIVNGKLVTKPALSEKELINFDRIGTLEAFNTDGLRTLIKTMKIPNMKEKTLRYPGHAEQIELLKTAGFFDKNFIVINGQKFKPVDLTSKILFPKWRLQKNEPEFTVMKIIIKGMKKDKEIIINYDLYDEYDPVSKFSSMARTTGLTCAAAAKLILEKKYNKKGIIPPEKIGMKKGCFNFIINYLNEKGIIYKYSES